MSLTIDDLKKLGEDTFAKLQIVITTGAEYLLKAKDRFTQTIQIVLSGEFSGKDAVQFFLNRMDDEKNVLKGMFFYLETIAKSQVETLANSVQSVLIKSAMDFLNSAQA